MYNICKLLPGAGVIIGAFFVLLDVVISNSFSAETFLISPVTLTQLKALSGINVQYGLTLRYAALFFDITLICLIGICLTLGSRKPKVERKGKIKRFIQVIDVCKTLEGQQILKNINLEFDSSKIHGIIGRNGSGKTVLIKCICGFMPVSSGSILVDDKRIGYDTEFIENTEFIIENPGFLNRYSGLKNLKYLASIRKIADVDRLRECMNMVGLDPDSKKNSWKILTGNASTTWYRPGVNGISGYYYTGRTNERAG